MKIKELLINFLNTIWMILVNALCLFMIIRGIHIFKYQEFLAEKISIVIFSMVYLGIFIGASVFIYIIWRKEDKKKEESWNKQVEKHLDTTSIIEKYDLHHHPHN